MNTNQTNSFNYTVFNGNISEIRKDMNVTLYDDIVAWEHLVLLVRNTPTQVGDFINENNSL